MPRSALALALAVATALPASASAGESYCAITFNPKTESPGTRADMEAIVGIRKACSPGEVLYFREGQRFDYVNFELVMAQYCDFSRHIHLGEKTLICVLAGSRTGRFIDINQ